MLCFTPKLMLSGKLTVLGRYQINVFRVMNFLVGATNIALVRYLAKLRSETSSTKKEDSMLKWERW